MYEDNDPLNLSNNGVVASKGPKEVAVVTHLKHKTSNPLVAIGVVRITHSEID